MPIVFVHGVSTRKDAQFGKNEQARNGFLREIVAPALNLDPDELTLLSPYWGDKGVTFAWNLASLPEPGQQGYETFGSTQEDDALRQTRELLADSKLADPACDADLIKLAKENLPAAVDLLYGSSMAGVQSEAEARALARSFVAASNYAQTTPAPTWIEQATTSNFADELTYASAPPGVESFGAGGILDQLKEAISRVKNAAPDLASGGAVRLGRKGLNQGVTRFAGDAFVYLAARGTDQAPGPIVQVVLDALRSARAQCNSKDDQLIVIAHSFGGEIMYDVLTHFDPGLSVDCLITVGSQVGLFEEMKLFRASRPDLPPDPPTGRVPKPPALKRWLNVFDTNDILSYRLEAVFQDVHDFHYDTGYDCISAHGGYFLRPSFYTRLAARLQQQDPVR